MTQPEAAKPRGERLPSSDARAAANQLRHILASHYGPHRSQTLTVVDDQQNRSDIVLPPALSHLLIEVLRHVGRGEEVALMPAKEMLTTQQAADILNVSRPYLISLLEKGELDFELVGRHRRIRADAVFDYKAQRGVRRRQALSALAEMDAEDLCRFS